MSGHERAVLWVTARFEGVDAAYRRDVQLTTGELCRGAGPRQRCAELAGLVGLTLRLRSRARTGNRPESIWSQGLRTGAILLLTALATQAAAAAGTAHVLVAVGLLGAVICALAGRPWWTACLVTAVVVAEWLWVAHGAPAAAFASACTVALGGVVAGRAAPPRRAGRVDASAALLVLVGAAAGIVLGGAAAETIAVVVFAWVLPLALVGLGWFDPRLAAAATTLVFARLAASGFGELGHALAALQLGGQRALLARWVLMGATVVAAWLVTGRSIRRLERL
jgi:hypothetical protein